MCTTDLQGAFSCLGKNSCYNGCALLLSQPFLAEASSCCRRKSIDSIHLHGNNGTAPKEGKPPNDMRQGQTQHVHTHSVARWCTSCQPCISLLIPPKLEHNRLLKKNQMLRKSASQRMQHHETANPAKFTSTHCLD